MNKSILITGVNGFIGSNLLSKLSKEKELCLYGSSRLENYNNSKAKKIFTKYNLSKDTNWSGPLSNIDCIVHCAAMTHVSNISNKNEYRNINLEGTLELARQAKKEGVKRFIFISSILVNGDKTNQGNVFLDTDIPKSTSFYGRTKHETEDRLIKLVKNSEMELVIIRPCLVYGKGVKGNFATLEKFIKFNVPLPLKNIKNKRSYIAIENLVDLIRVCIDHIDAKNKIFLASDDDDISTSSLIELLKINMNSKILLFHIPLPILKFFSMLIGKLHIINKLTESMVVDINNTKKTLGWKPKLTMKEALKE